MRMGARREAYLLPKESMGKKEGQGSVRHQKMVNAPVERYQEETPLLGATDWESHDEGQ